jgi:hypothetical protein
MVAPAGAGAPLLHCPHLLQCAHLLRCARTECPAPLSNQLLSVTELAFCDGLGSMNRRHLLKNALSLGGLASLGAPSLCSNRARAAERAAHAMEYSRFPANPA